MFRTATDGAALNRERVIAFSVARAKACLPVGRSERARLPQGGRASDVTQ